MRHFAVRDVILDEDTFAAKRPRMENGDWVVIVEGRHNATMFTALCKVVSVDSGRGDDPDEITLGPFTPLKPARLLEWFAGSLRRVNRPLYPWRTFNRNIVLLERDDFWSIVNFEIDPRRTLFQFLLASMPEALKLDFVRANLRDLTRGRSNRITSYGAGNERLLNFFESKVSEPLSLVSKLADQFRGLEAEEIQDLPELDELELTSGREAVVNLGEVMEETLGLIENTGLIARDGQFPPLLSAAREVLGAPTGRPRPRDLRQPLPDTISFVARSWKDLLF